MIKRWIMRILPAAAALAVLFQAQCLLIPEDVEVGERVANQRPKVRITAGAARPDTAGVDYKVEFQWNGSDADGVVAFFQWAVDDTVSERAWRDTTAFSARISFDATTQRPDDPREFTDWHTFFIRAIDNEFAISRPDKRYFNAVTVAPTSKITFPTSLDQTETPQLQQTVVVEWEGEDLDSSQPDRKPVFYEIKLVNIRNTFDDISVIRDSLRNGKNLLLDTLQVGSKTNWIRVPESQRRFTLRELPPSPPAYVFAVRAVDEAGAIEPALDRNRNFIAFDVTEEISAPFVTVSEPSAGVHTFPTDGDVWEIDVPANRPLFFDWTGDASHYGSLPGNSNYALDIPDPDDETLKDPAGIGGWIGWGRWDGNQDAFVFGNEEGGTTHTFYIYMRDVSDQSSSTRKGTIRMNVISFTFNKFALVVDDARFQVGINDVVHDAFLEETTYRRLRDYGEVDIFNVYTGSTERGSPKVTDLALVAEYRHIVWNLETYSGDSGLKSTETNRKILSSFLGAGGRLFVFGGPQAGAFLGQYSYPKEPPAPDDSEGRDQFFYKFMYLRNYIVSTRMGGICQDQAGGLFVARSANPAYPDLYLDTSKWDPWELVENESRYRGGLLKWEGNKAAIPNQPVTEPLQLGGLDTLYVAETWDRALSELCGDVRSAAGGGICGQRYESTRSDSLAGLQHGRIINFNFQTYYVQADRLLDANTAAVNWLVTGRDQ